jgi:DNA helicase HerA-like ATPase
MPLITEPQRANLIARALISDVAAYAGDQLRIGLEKDDVFERLGGEIERAHVFYEHTVAASVPDKERIFAHALVDVLIYGNRRVVTHIW